MYFLIEVQSTVAATMPLRMLIYAALLGLRLDSEYERPLPPMVPIVLYTEEPRWGASTDPAEMFGVWFAESVPRMRHYLLDLCRVEAEARSGNVMALLALVLQGASEEALFAGAEARYRRLVELGHKPMENSFFELVRALCDNKWPGQNWEDCSNMAELVSVLEERTITWPEKWRANYIAEGLAEGRKRDRGAECGNAMFMAPREGLPHCLLNRLGCPSIGADLRLSPTSEAIRWEIGCRARSSPGSASLAVSVG